MPIEIFCSPYPPNLQFSHMGDWLKTERRNQCCGQPVVPSTTTSYLGIAAAAVPAVQGSFGHRTRCFPSITRQKCSLSCNGNS